MSLLSVTEQLPDDEQPVLPVPGLRYAEPLVVCDDVGVHAEDGGVGGPHPGHVVPPELLDVAGQVDGLTLPHCQVHHLQNYFHHHLQNYFHLSK